MTERLRFLYAEARKKTKVECDEAHPHSATQRCLAGPEDALAVCEFAEYVIRMEVLIKKLNDALGKELDG